MSILRLSLVGYLTMQQMHGVVYLIYIEFVNVHYPSSLGYVSNNISVALLLTEFLFSYVQRQTNEVAQNSASFALTYSNYFSLLVSDILFFFSIRQPSITFIKV